MKLQLFILTTVFSVSACNPSASMDPLLTADYCSLMTESQFESKKTPGVSMFIGTLGGAPLTSILPREDADVTMPKRGVMKLIKGTSIKIGSGDNIFYVRARKDALIVLQKDGPICGPVV